MLPCLSRARTAWCATARDVASAGLTDERAGDELDLGRPVGLDVLEHRRVVADPRLVASTFISHGSSWSSMLAAAATALPSSTRPCTRCPRSVGPSSSAKWKSCDSPVSAATGLTAALKMSSTTARVGGPAGLPPSGPTRRSCRRCPARVWNDVSSYGPSHVSVSRMYSTCVSEWRVPLMNVTAETIGQSPCLRTTSSAPMPLSTVITVASGKRPSSASVAASRPDAFVATMATSNGGSSAGSAVAVTRAWRSFFPLTRRPSPFNAAACSLRRVSTETSQTRAR